MNQLMMEALLEKMAAHGIILAQPGNLTLPAGAPTVPVSQTTTVLYAEEQTDQDVHMEEVEDDLELSGIHNG